jgi:hypothetical protein
MAAAGSHGSAFSLNCFGSMANDVLNRNQRDFAMRKALILFTGLAAAIIPASAQISNDEAMRLCRSQVQQNAIERFGAGTVDFKSINLNAYGGVRDRVEGTFVMPRETGPETHTFACSVNMDNGNLRWVRIDEQAGNSANREGFSDGQVMDACRAAVRTRIHDMGYGGVDFNSINVDNTPGRADWVVGRAVGNRPNASEAFNFSCQVNRIDGNIRSLQVTGQ